MLHFSACVMNDVAFNKKWVLKLMNMFDISCDTLGIIVGCQTKLQQYLGRHFTLMDLYVTC